MGEDSDSGAKERADFCHQRANHEDMLFVSRTNVLIVFNGFLAVAVGIVTDAIVKVVFVSLVLIVDFVWIRWAPNTRKFIRALRDAGGTRPDEQVWKETVGPEQKTHSPPLTIFAVYVPVVLTIGWIVILAYFTWKITGN